MHLEAAGVSGFHLPAGRFAAADVVLEDVAGMGLPEVRAHVRELRLELARNAGPELTHCFALLLVDAESRCEERLAAVLGMELNGVPLIDTSKRINRPAPTFSSTASFSAYSWRSSIAVFTTTSTSCRRLVMRLLTQKEIPIRAAAPRIPARTRPSRS